MLMRADGRLTRQGRLFRTFLGLGVLLGALFVGTQAVADGSEAPTVVDTHTVAQGETLWEIAAEYRASGENTRDVVQEIMDLNGMSTATLLEGEQIFVPVSP